MRINSLKREIVITCIGVVTPIDHGRGVDVFWQGLCNGVDAIKPIKGFDVRGHKCDVGGEISGFEVFLQDYWQQGHDRCTQLFALACQYALKDAMVTNAVLS